MTYLPKQLRSFKNELGTEVSDGKLTAEEAGRKLAGKLKDEYPLIWEVLAVNWCTARFRRYNPLPEGWLQASLFPASYWQRPLADVIRYAETQEGITAPFAGRGTVRAQELSLLVQAAGGNLDMTLEQAYQLAHPEEEAM